MSLRNKLIVVFLAATLVPMAVLVWVTIHLFEASLSQATTSELDEISQSLRSTGREMYQTAREMLRADVQAGRGVAGRGGDVRGERGAGMVRDGR